MQGKGNIAYLQALDAMILLETDHGVSEADGLEIFKDIFDEALLAYAEDKPALDRIWDGMLAFADLLEDN